MEEQMESKIPTQDAKGYRLKDLLQQMKRSLFKWLIVAVIAGLAVLLIHWLLLPERGMATAMIGYGYTGIESGRNPIGNCFDPNEIKNTDVIRAAGLAVQREFTDDEIKRIQECITIRGSVPSDVLSQIVSYESTIADSNVAVTTDIRKKSYYPTRFEVLFDYRSAGYGDNVGDALFDAILNSYHDWFYAEYGYSSSIESSMRAFDYQEYDYDNAVEVFDADLSLLQNYIAALASKDSTRFVSTETGYSFADLADAAKVIRNEDLSRVRSYILYNNLTRSREEKVNYYNFKLQKAERDLKVDQERLETLTALIEGYEKTQAVIAGNTAAGSYSVTTHTEEAAEAAEGEEGVPTVGTTAPAAENVFVYQVSQQSDAYDSLVSQRISCETSIARRQEEIDYYNERMQKYSSSANAGSIEMAEEMLAGVDTKVSKLLDDTVRTSKDFYENVWLKNAVQKLSVSGGGGLHAGSTVRASLLDGIATEALIFGLWILLCLIKALRPQEEKKDAKKAAEPAVEGGSAE